MNIPLNIDWQQILLHLFNFVVLFAVLYFLLYAPVKKFMDGRVEHYKKIDDEANEKLKNAAELQSEYNARLQGADSEIEEKKLSVNKELSEKTAQEIQNAKKEAEKIISDAHKKAEDEKNKILQSAQNEIADMAIKATEKIVKKSSTKDAYDEFLGSFEEE